MLVAAPAVNYQRILCKIYLHMAYFIQGYVENSHFIPSMPCSQWDSRHSGFGMGRGMNTEM